jgi:hypothetical protein
MSISDRDSLTLRQARALIRHRVRKRLAEYSGQDIWSTAFFIDRLDLAAEAFPYQSAQSSDGSVAEIEKLIEIAREELIDFVLIEDTDRRATLPQNKATIVCEACSHQYEVLGPSPCPLCGHPNLYWFTQMELEMLAKQLEPDIDDPITRWFLAETEQLRTETAYQKLVTCFETFHKNLNQLAFAQSGMAEVRLSRPNLFQNIRDGWDWFRRHHGIDLEKGLGSEDIRSLEQAFNKRHIIAHNGGIIDRKYIARTGADPAQIGKPVDLQKREVLKAISLIKRVLHTAKEALPC